MINLDLDAEQEQRLREIAEAKGLTVEGYLLTLAEAIVRPVLPPKRATLTSLLRIPNRPDAGGDPRVIAEAAIRQMQADLQAYKEQAVEAVTRMNLLGKITEKQQLIIAEK
jgi:hypothetical protein